MLGTQNATLRLYYFPTTWKSSVIVSCDNTQTWQTI